MLKAAWFPRCGGDPLTPSWERAVECGVDRAADRSARRSITGFSDGLATSTNVTSRATAGRCQRVINVPTVLDAQPGTRYPNCAAGRRACPPEDVGGPWGYGDFLQALSDPKHDEHEHWSEWIDGSFDPDAFELVATDTALDAYAWGAGPLRPVR